MNSRNKLAGHRLLLLGFASLILGVATPVRAAEDGNTAISQGFMVEGEVVEGTLVSFTSTSTSGSVVASDVDNVEKLVGVVGDNQLVELSGGQQETQVVTGGATWTLVSDINGSIENGDKVTASPVSGVGMKAVESTQSVGIAQASFASAQNIKERQITDQNGVSKTIRIGLLPVQVNVAYFQKKDDDKSFLPQFLQRFINAIAGQPVSPVRAFIAIALFIVGIGGVSAILYSSVRSSILSIGRNPLAAKAVHTGLFEVAGIVVSILLVMLVAVYLVLVT